VLLVLAHAGWAGFRVEVLGFRIFLGFEVLGFRVQKIEP
jgi:hypothetical protein